jgi:hypothetical protein
MAIFKIVKYQKSVFSQIYTPKMEVLQIVI